MIDYEMTCVVMEPKPSPDGPDAISRSEIAATFNEYLRSVTDQRSDGIEVVDMRIVQCEERLGQMTLAPGIWLGTVRITDSGSWLCMLHLMTTQGTGGRWTVCRNGVRVRCRSLQHARRLARRTGGRVTRWNRRGSV